MAERRAPDPGGERATDEGAWPASGDEDAFEPAGDDTASEDDAAGDGPQSAVDARRRDGSTSAALAAVPSTIEHRSPYLSTCPFFRSVDEDGLLGPPVEEPDPANRCGAFGEAKPQSSRQQDLVCLTRGHVDCPRFLRGALALREAAELPPPRTLTRATFAALVLLVASAGASLGFVMVRGGLTLPIAPSGTQVAAGSTATPSTSQPPIVEPSASTDPTPAATLPPTLPPTPSPSPAPTPTATAVPPSPTATPPPLTPAPAIPTPRPTSNRYALLEPCPDRPACWIYTIRSGDNLFSIANYFGHSLETVYRLNPWARTTPLRAGQELVLPPPNR